MARPRRLRYRNFRLRHRKTEPGTRFEFASNAQASPVMCGQRSAIGQAGRKPGSRRECGSTAWFYRSEWYAYATQPIGLKYCSNSI
jgi:hypothetical protein